MYIQRVKIENWKNFRAGDVNLSRRLFLIGPNASGKSNFLDIFRFLRDLSLSKGGGLREAVERRSGVSAIRCLAARNYSDITIEVEINDENENIWLYRLSFNQDKQRTPLIKHERVDKNGIKVFSRPDGDDRLDNMRLTQTALEQISANKDFRPVVGFFQSVNYQHLLPQVIRDPQGFSPGQIENDPFGRDLLQRVENTPVKVRDSRLNKILRALKTAAPQLKELNVTRDNLGVPHLVAEFEHWRPYAGKQDETKFSDGTLRLFGLLWSLFEGEGPLLMEEPELSLHTEVVRRLPSLIERVNRYRKTKRQIIVSTHAEEILSNEDIDASEVLRLEPSKNGTLLRSPLEDPDEMAQLKTGLTIADVVLPKSSPKSIHQLEFPF
jgi:predicted ATPase